MALYLHKHLFHNNKKKRNIDIIYKEDKKKIIYLNKIKNNLINKLIQ